jgi:hypothetical protein
VQLSCDPAAAGLQCPLARADVAGCPMLRKIFMTVLFGRKSARLRR